jgi:Coenzyme PQQ synthesis protein D (PqqD)
MWLPPALRVSTNDDGLVLLNVETGQIYTSNEVGSRIWRLLDEGRGLAEIAAHLAETYGQPEAAIAEDVREFVGGLQTLGVRPVL